MIYLLRMFGEKIIIQSQNQSQALISITNSLLLFIHYPHILGDSLLLFVYNLIIISLEQAQ